MPRQTPSAGGPPDSLLTIDVGNTSTSAAVFPLRSGWIRPFPLRIKTLSTPEIRTPSACRAFLRSAIPPQSRLAAVLVSSVVPNVDASLKKNLRAVAGLSPHFVTASTSSRVKIRYRVPSEVGADRIVNARAAMALAAGPSIVVDFGTATTFDCVTAKGEYLGGVIAPGPVISAEALYERTAKLPRVILSKPAQVLGRNTLESIQAGLYHGYRGLVKEILAELKKKMGRRATVFATGGQATWILQGIAGIDHFVADMTHLGLYCMWRDMNRMPNGLIDFKSFG